MKYPAEQVTSARAVLLENLQDGCTLYLINRRVTASGQTRFVSSLIIGADGSPRYFSYHVARVLGMSYVPGGRHDSIRISALGLDVGTYLAQKLSASLGISVRHQWL